MFKKLAWALKNGFSKNKQYQNIDSDEITKSKVFSRRVFVVGFVQAFVGLTIVARLVNLQIFGKKKYSLLAENNKYHPEFILPLRGNILDRNNKPLATNQTFYRAVLESNTKTNLKRLAKVFVPLLDDAAKITPEQLASTWLIDLKKNPRDNLVLKSFLSKDEITRISYHQPELPFVFIEEDAKRIYNLGNSAAHIVGYLGALSKKAVEKLPFYWKRIASKGYKVGLGGAEKVFENKLAGEMGIYVKAEDSFGRNLGGIVHKEPIQGKSVTLTIDSDLQVYAAKLMEGKVGSIVLMDVNTGDILSMVSTPSFDSNQVSRKIDNETWQIMNSTKNTFLNKSTLNLYSPGSIFKTVSVLSILENGISPQEKYRCTGTFRLGNRIFHCHKEYGHGIVDAYSALLMSCNCYLYNYGKTMDVDHVAKIGNILGLGSTYDNLLLPTRSGCMPTKAWKKGKIKTPWVQGDTLNTMIGQGFVEMTPLQMATMTARIASGKIVEPNILVSSQDIFTESKNGKTKAQVPELPISQNSLNSIRKSMLGVFEDERGTARWYKPKNGVQVCGKSGTAQIVSRRIDNKLLNAGVIDESIVPHGLFIAFAPSDKPRFACSVVVEHGIAGSRQAPLCTSLLLAAIEKYPEEKS